MSAAIDYDEIERLARAVVAAGAVRADPTMIAPVRAQRAVDEAYEAYEAALSPDVVLEILGDRRRLRRIEAAARATLADYLGDDAAAGEWPTMDALGAALDEPVKP